MVVLRAASCGLLLAALTDAALVAKRESSPSLTVDTINPAVEAMLG